MPVFFINPNFELDNSKFSSSDYSHLYYIKTNSYHYNIATILKICYIMLNSII